MPASSPDDIHTIFGDGLNARDVDRVADLFEETAILISDRDNIVRGRAAIRQGLQNFLEIKPTMKLNASRVARNGDIAILYSDWTVSGVHPHGAPFAMNVRPTHVARRQPDGSWRIVIDDPSAGDLDD